MSKMTCTALRLSLLAAVCLCSPSLIKSLSEDDFETVRTSNAAILNRLGLVPLVLPEDGHHRKRLAGPEAFGARDATGSRLSNHQQQSSYGRRHNGGGNSGNHDSHVYIVKLPASAPYYSFSKPHKHHDPNVSIANPKPGFKNNGKPAKIYHWNLPLVKKINEKKKQLALNKIDQAKKKMETERERLKVLEKMSYFKKLAQEQLAAETQRKPSRNNDKWLSEPEKIEPRMKGTSSNATQLKILSSSSAEKSYRLSDTINQESQERESSRSASIEQDSQQQFNTWRENESNDVPSSRNALLLLDAQKAKKHRKKSAVSYYYAPSLAGKAASTSISKHFPGNGKPKAFYVMEKSRKPIYYHPLLP